MNFWQQNILHKYFFRDCQKGIKPLQKEKKGVCVCLEGWLTARQEDNSHVSFVAETSGTKLGMYSINCTIVCISTASEEQ